MKQNLKYLIVLVIMAFLLLKIPNITPQKCETDIISLYNQAMPQTTSEQNN